MKSNISFISLINEFSKELSKPISEQLDLYSVDVADFMSFNMIDDQQVINTCGRDYLDKLQQKTIANVSNFENTIITLHSSLFMNDKNVESLRKTSLIVYLKITEGAFSKLIKKERDEIKKRALMADALVFAERNNHCEKNSDIIVNIEGFNLKAVCKKIIKEINNFYK